MARKDIDHAKVYKYWVATGCTSMQLASHFQISYQTASYILTKEMKRISQERKDHEQKVVFTLQNYGA